MKYFYSKVGALLFLGMLVLSFSLKAQTTLAAGDILFTGYDATPTTNDKFSFVLMKDIAAETTIYFTDRGYTGSGWISAGANESTISWTTHIALKQGAEITITGLTETDRHLNYGINGSNGEVMYIDGITFDGGLDLDDQGDQIIAFQGGGGNPALGTLIAGMNYYSCPGVLASSTYANWNQSCVPVTSQSSLMPPGLTAGISAFHTGTIGSTTIPSSGKYNCNGGGSITSLGQLGTILHNPASNWALSTTPITLPSACDFTIYTIPVVTKQPPNRTICSGGGTTFSVTATGGALTYQWQMNNGAGFINLSNGGVYSNVNTTELTITNAPHSMNGYQYRCVVSNGTLFTTSNSATLSVVTIAVTANATPVSCNGGSDGSVTASATGGINFYSYSWSSGAETATAAALAPGNYTVTVTDDIGCIGEATTTVNEPTPISINTVSQSDVPCKGSANGKIEIEASGGTPAYTYSWDHSTETTAAAVALPAGLNTVTVTDSKNCTATKSFTVNEPLAALTASAGAQTNASCYGLSDGSATVNVAGGTGAYTYSWAPSGGSAATATGLAAGTYMVTIKDANLCETTQTFTITQPDEIIPNGTVTNVSCYGESTGEINLNPTGGAGEYTYQWSSGGAANTESNLAVGAYSVTVTDKDNCKVAKTFNVTQPAAALSATSASSPVTCNGLNNGQAAVTVSGGTALYTYSWDHSASTAPTAIDLPAGNNTVTVTDAKGCTLTKNFNITQPTPITMTGTTGEVSCYGGANGMVSVVVNGGTPGYTYQWSPFGGTASQATGLTAGTYSVTVKDANGCTATGTYTVEEPTQLIASAESQTNVLCYGDITGKATVGASGGTAPYSYTWSSSSSTDATASNLSGGTTYTATVKDLRGCTASQAFTITQPAKLAITSPSIANVACHGASTGSASITAQGGTGAYTYAWSPGGGTGSSISGVPAGTYEVLVTDENNCQYSQTINILEPQALVASVDAQTDASCNGTATGSATVKVTGGMAPYSYSWSPSGGTGETATGLRAGDYTVTVTDNYACTTTQDFSIAEPAPLTVVPSQTDVSCNGGANGSAEVAVSGGTGIYTYSWAPSGGTAYKATGLTAGTYEVTITDTKGCQKKQSFTINQPAVLNASTTTLNIACFGDAAGAAAVTPSGGTAPYTYAWTSGSTAATASNLRAGNYSAVVTDSKGCVVTKYFTITENTALVTSISDLQDVSCNSMHTGSATIYVTGGQPGYLYSWSSSGSSGPTAGSLGAGDHTVTITDAAGCKTTRDFTINEPAPLVATPSQTDIRCYGGTGAAEVAVTGGTGAYTYSWSPSGGTGYKATGLAAGNYSVIIQDANLCQTIRNFTLTPPAALSVTPDQTDILCNGTATGTASVQVTGGVAPYAYFWSPSGGNDATARGLVAGNWDVLISDANGCSTNQSFTLTEPSALTVSPGGQTNILCNGQSTGSATVNVSGGTAPYTYSWYPSGATTATAASLSAGHHTVTVTDANGCTATQVFTITEPSAITLTPSQIDVSCNGGNNGSATIAVTGGTGAYTYAWLPAGGTAATASGLVAGTYTATVTDVNNCQSSVDIIVNEPDALTLDLSATHVVVPGNPTGTITAAVAGGTAPYTYAWTPNAGNSSQATSLAAGQYTCDVTDANGCTIAKSIYVKESATISAPAAINVTYGDAAFEINPATNSTGAISYDITDQDIAVVDGAFIKVLKPGNTTIKITQQEDGHYLNTTSTTALTVNPKSLQVNFTNAAISKTYDGTTAATISTDNYTLSGMLPGEDVSVSGNAYYASKDQGNGIGITWDALRLSGAQKDNYTIVSPATTTGQILPKAISIKANAAQKVYGQDDPQTLGYSITQGELITGDEFIGALLRDAGENVNTYAIKQGSLKISDNYILTFTAEQFEITKAPLLITAEDKSIVQGDAIPELTYNYSGFVNNETGTVLTTLPQIRTTATSSSVAGVYPITVDGASAANYDIQYQAAKLTITAVTPTKINFTPEAVYENMPAQTLAGSLQAEPATSVYTYELVTGEGSQDNSSFTITGNRLYTNASLDYETQSVYHIRVKATSISGVSFESAVIIQVLDVNEAPTIGTIADQEICYDPKTQTITIGGLSAGPEANQALSFTIQSDTDIFSLLEIVNNSTIRYAFRNNITGTAQVTVKVKDNGGTANGGTDEASANFKLTVNQTPEFVINSDKTGPVLALTPVMLTANGNANTYAWTANGTIIESISPTVTVKPSLTTTYQVEGTSGNCSSTQTYLLEVKDVPTVIPTNILTPNGDGYNDKWVVKYIELFPDNDVKIFDRAGHTVYQRQGYRNEWDGTINGRPLETGAYLYIITLKDRPVVKGYLTIIR